jgi:hypothetical protein
MSRKVCVTACDGQTGFLIAELLLTNSDFSGKVDSVTGLTLHPRSAKAAELQKLGAKVVTHHHGHEREMVKTLKDIGCDTICLIPPADKDKFDIVIELSSAAGKAGIQNVLLLSSVGCDLADPQKQPRLREFIEMEAKVLSSKGDPNTPLGHSPCVIRYVRNGCRIHRTDSYLQGRLLRRKCSSLYPTDQRKENPSSSHWQKTQVCPRRSWSMFSLD